MGLLSTFSFGDVEDALGTLYSIAPSKRVAFGGRIKSLHKYGVPHRSDTPGRGRAATFDFMQVLQYAVGVALLHNSIQPVQAGSLIVKTWHMIRPGILIGVRAAMAWEHSWLHGEMAPPDRRKRWLFFTTANAFADLQNDDPIHNRWYGYGGLFDPKNDQQMGSMVTVLRESPGWTMIDISRITADVAKHLIFQGKADGAELYRQARGELDKEQAATKKFLEVRARAGQIPPEGQARCEFAADWADAANKCFPNPMAYTMSAAFEPDWIDQTAGALSSEGRAFLRRASNEDLVSVPSDIFGELASISLIEPHLDTIWKLSRYGEAVQKALRLAGGDEHVHPTA